MKKPRSIAIDVDLKERSTRSRREGHELSKKLMYGLKPLGSTVVHGGTQWLQSSRRRRHKATNRRNFRERSESLSLKIKKKVEKK